MRDEALSSAFCSNKIASADAFTSCPFRVSNIQCLSPSVGFFSVYFFFYDNFFTNAFVAKLNEYQFKCQLIDDMTLFIWRFIRVPLEDIFIKSSI